MMLTCSFCSFMQAALEPAGGEKWQRSLERLFMGWGSRMSQSFIVIDLMLCLLVGKKTNREVAWGFFPRARGQTRLAGCARQDFAAVGCN
jgi:hypothetical protein